MKLKHIKLNSKNITDLTLEEHLTEKVLRKAYSIDLSNNAISNFSEIVKRIKNNRVLKYLDLTFNPLDIGEQDLDLLRDNVNLVEFHLDPLVFTTSLSRLQLLTFLERNKLLKKLITGETASLNLQKWLLTAKDIEIVTNEIFVNNIKCLTEINLADCDLVINAEIAHHICHLLELNPTIKKISFANNKFKSSALTLLQKKITKLQIEDVTWYGCMTIDKRKDPTLKADITDGEQIFHMELNKKVFLKEREMLNNARHLVGTVTTRHSFTFYSQFSFCNNMKMKYNFDGFNLSRLRLGVIDQKEYTYEYMNSDGFSDTNKDINILILHLFVSGDGVSLRQVNFYKSNLFGCVFLNVRLNFACLRAANLSRIKWVKVDLTRADLIGAITSMSEFRDCILVRAEASCIDLTETNFHKSDLRGINLTKAILRRAKFKDVNLKNANLSGADLRDTVFNNVDLSGADLRHTIGFERENFKNVNLQGAQLPRYFLCKAQHFQKLDGIKQEDAFLIAVFAKINKGPLYTSKRVIRFAKKTENRIISFAKLTQTQDEIVSFTDLTQNEVNQLRYLALFAKDHMPVLKQLNRLNVYNYYLNHIFNSAGLPSIPIRKILSYLDSTTPVESFIKKAETSGAKSFLFFQKERRDISLLLIKPAGRKHFTYICTELTKYNLKITAAKSMMLSKEQVQSLYIDEKNQYYFDGVIDYLTSGNVLALAVEGDSQRLLELKLHLRDVLANELTAKAAAEIIALRKENWTANDINMLIDEYMRIFNIMHSSDPTHGQRETKIFFGDQMLKNEKILKDERIKIILKNMKEYPDDQNQIPAKQSHKDKSKPKEQRFLLMVKPEGMPHLTTIIQQINKLDIKILAARTEVIPKAKIKLLYQKYANLPFYEASIKYIADRGVCVFALQGKPKTMLKCATALHSLLMPNIIARGQQELDGYLKNTKTSTASIDKDVFLKRYSLTFDIAYTSEAADGEKELELFFQPHELVSNELEAKEKIAILLKAFTIKKLIHQEVQVELPSFTK